VIFVSFPQTPHLTVCPGTPTHFVHPKEPQLLHFTNGAPPLLFPHFGHGEVELQIGIEFSSGCKD